MISQIATLNRDRVILVLFQIYNNYSSQIFNQSINQGTTFKKRQKVAYGRFVFSRTANEISLQVRDVRATVLITRDYRATFCISFGIKEGWGDWLKVGKMLGQSGGLLFLFINIISAQQTMD